MIASYPLPVRQMPAVPIPGVEGMGYSIFEKQEVWSDACAKLYEEAIQRRWRPATDVPWDDFDRVRLSDEQAATIKMNAITEWAALPATEMFLRDNRDDSDFSAFMSIWFFEEQKHSLVLIEYLRRFAPDLVPTEEELLTILGWIDEGAKDN